jgi:hypothetical protein
MAGCRICAGVGWLFKTDDGTVLTLRKSAGLSGMAIPCQCQELRRKARRPRRPKQIARQLPLAER